MIGAIVVFIIWVGIGLYGIALENVEHNMTINIPFCIFMVAVPFLPWIFRACGLVV